VSRTVIGWCCLLFLTPDRPQMGAYELVLTTHEDVILFESVSCGWHSSTFPALFPVIVADCIPNQARRTYVALKRHPPSRTGSIQTPTSIGTYGTWVKIA